MAKSDAAAAVSSESAEFLEDVKKGKPRRFAMICKGTSVISLVLYKKGSVEKYKKEAKEGGKGQFYFGVVDGKGMDLRFALARSDGFESEPVKNSILKSFLDESADFKCKPYFEIVDQPPSALDPDDPLVARYLRLKPLALGTAETQPEKAGEIQSLLAQIPLELEADQMDQATQKLDRLESLLGPATKTEPTTKPEPTGDQKKLLEALEKLKPAFSKAVELHPGEKATLVEGFVRAGKAIKELPFEQAKNEVMMLGKHLQSLIAQPTATPAVAETDTSLADFQKRVQQMEANFIAAQRAHPDKASKLLQVWDYAQQKADAGDFKTANKALDGLEATIATLLANAPKTDTERFGIRDGIVAEKRKELEEFFKQRLEAAQKETDKGVRQLETPLDEHIENSKELVAAINRDLHSLYEKILNKVNAALQSNSKEEVASALEECRGEVAGNQLIMELANTASSLEVDTGIIDQFASLFADATDKMEKLFADVN